ncbi:MAG: DUF3826 domain-containing protein [Bacteroidota bacterium]
MVQKVCVLLAGICFLLSTAFSQVKMTAAEKEAYNKSIFQRAEKIVNTLDITNRNKAHKVKKIIVDQYSNLNIIHTKQEVEAKELKTNSELTKNELQEALRNNDSASVKSLNKLHGRYLKKLSKKLTSEQVEKVKDGMTYGVLPITYKGYQDMIPTLTDPQKAQILAWLTEAREHAMDAGSSEKKHAWFGKYKGKINNYLSAQGYDSQKERAKWELRMKAAGKSF